MKAIPRIQPTLPFSDIIAFLINLITLKPQPDREAIIADFEKKFSHRFGLPQGICFSKARTGFYYLLKTMGLKSGGEVLISAIHVADFVNMICLAGFKPVVVDLMPNTYTIDYDDLERKINKNTVLMFITHLSGYATDMDRIVQISQNHDVPFIEDCSQALSSQYNNHPLGVFGKAAIFSLSLLKPVCTLSGGMVLTSDTELLEKLRREMIKLQPPPKLPLIAEAIKNIILRIAVNHVLFGLLVFRLMRMTMPIGDYFSKYQKTNKTVILRNSMPAEFLTKFTWQQAVMGLSQLMTLEDREKVRIENGLYLYDKLKKYPWIKIPPVIKGSLNSFWLFPVLVQDADRLKRFLAANHIDSSKFLLSVLGAEEAFQTFKFDCETAKYIKEHTLFIPIYQGIARKEQDYIIKIIGKYRD